MTSGSEMASHQSVSVDGVWDHVVEKERARDRGDDGALSAFVDGVEALEERVVRFVGEDLAGVSSSARNSDGCLRVETILEDSRSWDCTQPSLKV